MKFWNTLNSSCGVHCGGEGKEIKEGKSTGEGIWLWSHKKLGLPGGSVVKNVPANAGDVGSISELGRPLEEETVTSILAGIIP